MDEIEAERNEEEIASRVAEVLSQIGFSASSEDTGGGTFCVVLQRHGGGEIIWGTADFTWGASVTDGGGQIVSALQTHCPSDTLEIARIAEALRPPSIEAGAILHS
jgi:hypothetical protein